MKRLWNSFKIAFSMYSKIPMPHSEWTEENTSYAMCFFPWIGGVIGIVTWGIYHLERWLASYGIDYGSLFFTILMVVAPIIITGGIHMDGFLDTQDALGSYQPRERRLETSSCTSGTALRVQKTDRIISASSNPSAVKSRTSKF